MELQEFVKNFEDQFEEVAPGSLKPETELECIDEWSSLQALVVIAMIDAKYGIKVTTAELSNAGTIADVFELVKNKK